MTVRPSGHLTSVEIASHGGPNYAEYRRLGISPEEVLDFSVNLNPAEPPKALRRILAEVEIGRYPDSEAWEVREAAAERLAVGTENIIAGNGSVELIWLTCLAYLEPGDTVVIGRPTFTEYEAAAILHGARVVRYSTFDNSSEDELSALSALVKDTRAKLVFVCNPNNPTGRFHPPEALLGVAVEHPRSLFAIDEAYVDFIPGAPTIIRRNMPGNVVVLRSLTKFSALAGLRLGLAISSTQVIGNIRRARPPWNVNCMAQAAGAYVLRHPAMGPDLSLLAEGKAVLYEGLIALGLSPMASDCHFFLVPVQNLVSPTPQQLPSKEARAPYSANLSAAGEVKRRSSATLVRERLLGEGCLVRDCTSFGLPHHIRISARHPSECARLIAAFRGIAPSLRAPRMGEPRMTLTARASR